MLCHRKQPTSAQRAQGRRARQALAAGKKFPLRFQYVGCKWCAGCRKALTPDAFAPNRTLKDGRESRCRDCQREASRIYRESPEGRAIKRESWQRYMASPGVREAQRERHRAYRAAHPEAVRESQKRTRTRRGPEAERERQRRYRATPEGHEAKRKADQRYKASHPRSAPPGSSAGVNF